MTPYYSDGSVRIFHGDCRDILPQLDSVDLILTDPPYLNLSGGFVRDFQGGVAQRRMGGSVCVTDPWAATLDWMPLAWQVAKCGLMVFCSFHSICETQHALPGAKPIALLTWYKRNSPPTGKNVPWYSSEFIWAFNKSPGLKWDAFKTTVFDVPMPVAGCMATERFTDSQSRATHPTQKPERLIKQLLCVEPASVLDPFMGTGTTLRAAKDLGLQAIGVEIEERYCEIAAKRMSQEVFAFEEAQ